MSTERVLAVKRGWGMLGLAIVGMPAILALFITCAVALDKRPDPTTKGLCVAGMIAAGFGLAGWILLVKGFMAIQPNTAAVLTLFGEYRGTVREAGFWWANPFYSKAKLSLRTRNFNTEKIKVNDLSGSPIEIAAVVVWRVVDTARASFDVESYTSFVNIQSESAIRHLASTYPYDGGTEGGKSLRGSAEEISATLMKELQERLEKAGIVIDEARLSHLAYAPEIAGAMLRRQQAEAVVAARMKIVEGAVGMVEMALDHMARSRQIVLDDERKASMVSNLMVVLCGDHSAQPVVNTGSLYS